uniref:Cytochrome P450 n=1 Tax=Timema bartmani TaxID=61472 RepID=A0A7R9FAI4_9NEOP|nr:unnamed protein product [Timema bartmani]
MGVLLDSWLLELLVVTGGLFLAIYWYLTSTFDYWKLKGVPYLEPTPLLGNMKDPVLMQRCQHEVLNDIYQKFEGNRYCGLYQFKQLELMVRNPELVKNALVKDFSNFQNRLKNVELTHNRIFENFFVLGAPKWRPLRVMISPTFTSGKLKAMFGILVRCAEKLNVSLETSANKSEVLEMKEVSSNFTTDVIGSCAFRLQVDSVINPHNKFREFGRKMVSLSLLQMLGSFLLFFIPYFVVMDAIEYRQKNYIKGNDFLQLIMELKEKGKVSLNAGFETSASVSTSWPSTRIFNRNSVLEDHGGELTYDAVQNMTYLGMVVDETLRKYPVVGFLTRECTDDYPVLDSNWVLKRGTSVIIPVYSLHPYPKYFPEPERFDPERFTEQNKKSRPHYCYLPFGEGPGLYRFGLLQTKVGLASLISKYEFKLSEKSELPIRFKPSAGVLSSISGIHLSISHRNK